MRDIGVLEFLWTWKFEAFTVTLKEIIRKEERPDTMAAIIRKLVQKIEVTESGVVIHYHVGENLFVREFNEELGSDMLNSDPKNKTGQVNLTRPVSKSLLKYKSSNFFYDSGSNSLKIGSETHLLSERAQPAVIIELPESENPGIYENFAELYLKGHSLREIAHQTGTAKSVIRRRLLSDGIKLRSHIAVPFTSKKIAAGKSNIRPPYGFCYFQGRIVPDQKEYRNLLLIFRLWKSDTNPNRISDLLNEKNIPPRIATCWNRNSVINILTRFENKQIVSKGGQLELR